MSITERRISLPIKPFESIVPPIDLRRTEPALEPKDEFAGLRALSGQLRELRGLFQPMKIDELPVAHSASIVLLKRGLGKRKPDEPIKLYYDPKTQEVNGIPFAQFVDPIQIDLATLEKIQLLNSALVVSIEEGIASFEEEGIGIEDKINILRRVDKSRYGVVNTDDMIPVIKRLLHIEDQMEESKRHRSFPEIHRDLMRLERFKRKRDDSFDTINSLGERFPDDRDKTFVECFDRLRETAVKVLNTVSDAVLKEATAQFKQVDFSQFPYSLVPNPDETQEASDFNMAFSIFLTQTDFVRRMDKAEEEVSLILREGTGDDAMRVGVNFQDTMINLDDKTRVEFLDSEDTTPIKKLVKDHLVTLAEGAKEVKVVVDGKTHINKRAERKQDSKVLAEKALRDKLYKEGFTSIETGVIAAILGDRWESFTAKHEELIAKFEQARNFGRKIGMTEKELQNSELMKMTSFRPEEIFKEIEKRLDGFGPHVVPILMNSEQDARVREVIEKEQFDQH